MESIININQITKIEIHPKDEFTVYTKIIKKRHYWFFGKVIKEIKKYSNHSFDFSHSSLFTSYTKEEFDIFIKENFPRVYEKNDKFYYDPFIIIYRPDGYDCVYFENEDNLYDFINKIKSEIKHHIVITT
jgi:hypothetical protein